MAYALLLVVLIWKVVSLKTKLRVEGGVVTVNPDTEKLVSPDNVIWVLFWEYTVGVPE